MSECRMLSGRFSSSSSSDGPPALLFLSGRFMAAPLAWSRNDAIWWRGKASRFVAAARRSEQDHYAVLGISRRASVAEVKRAYRFLARKYHPDVSRDDRSDELFKSIRLAYEVLSDETVRSNYDRELRLQEQPPPRSPLWSDAKMDEWAVRRQQLWQRRHARRGERKRRSPSRDRGPFADVLFSVILSLFLMQMVGTRAALTAAGVLALVDGKLDGGYKMGYVVAWVMGGQLGVALTIGISFVSWLWGKRSSGVVALMVVMVWVSGRLAMLVPMPRGAILTLLYLSMKLQFDIK